jgi:WD40 repeat protein
LVHSARVTHVIFSPDGRLVATASRDRTARVWDANTGAAISPPLRHNAKNGVWRVAFSPEGSRLVTAAQDGTARIWDANTGAPITQPLKHSPSDLFNLSGQGVECVAFSPNGQRVATASDDKTARVWDAATGAPITPPLPHTRTVIHVAFSHNGRYVATASGDRTARVWDAATGQPVTPPLMHDGEVGSAQFTPDDRRLTTVSLDEKTHTARVWSWDCSPDERPVNALLSLAQVLSLQRLDASGTLVPLDTEALSNAWWRVGHR